VLRPSTVQPSRKFGHSTSCECLVASSNKHTVIKPSKWIEDNNRQYEASVPEVIDPDIILSAPSHSSSRREDISEKIVALQNRLDDMHQLATFDNDPFREVVNAELDRCASRSKAKNLLEATELYSLELLEEEFQGLVEKLDEAERKIQALEARGEARAEELRKWMEEDALVYLLFLFSFHLLQNTARTRSRSSRTGWKPTSSTRGQR